MAVGGIDGSMSGPATANTHVPRSTVRATSNVTPETVSLAAHGITGPVVRANLRHSDLVENACRRGELTTHFVGIGVRRLIDMAATVASPTNPDRRLGASVRN